MIDLQSFNESLKIKWIRAEHAHMIFVDFVLPFLLFCK